MRKKLLAVLLCVCMLFALAAPTAAAYSDTANSWASGAINTWSDYGVITGSDGFFRPGDALTHGELATIIAQMLNLPAAAGGVFSDVPDGQWFASGINRCFAAGIMFGSDGKANPLTPVTREEAFVLLGRALGIKPVATTELGQFSDAGKVSSWAAGMMAALVEKDIVNGIAGALAPGQSIDRASTVTVLNNAITTYANVDGATVTAAGEGIVLVVADNVTVTGTAENIVIAQGAGDTTLNNVTVTDTVTVAAADAKVAVTGTSTVENLNVAAGATGATVETAKGTTIDNVVSEADGAAISGSGTVTNATVSGNNTKVDTAGTKVEVAEGVTGTTANGSAVAGGTTTETGSAAPSGGGGSPVAPPNNDPGTSDETDDPEESQTPDPDEKEETKPDPDEKEPIDPEEEEKEAGVEGGDSGNGNDGDELEPVN